ncbi:unnamed protein product [Polarella glacialis]|uniref:EF-hand domain-containing protein n=1 Tax=Polarella glacialis TaxID=89957 RepID=A0A813LIN0_POLGL|nr:unnamed protein product [Polarella glacialis]
MRFGDMDDAFWSIIFVTMGAFDGAWFPKTTGWSRVLFVLYMVLVNVVMMNVLIAVISDCYAGIQGSARSFFDLRQLEYAAQLDAMNLTKAAKMESRLAGALSAALGKEFGGRPLETLAARYVLEAQFGRIPIHRNRVPLTRVAQDLPGQGQVEFRSGERCHLGAVSKLEAKVRLPEDSQAVEASVQAAEDLANRGGAGAPRGPDPDAAQKMRKLMIDKYGHYLRAWRLVMDKDNSNTCNWNEFVAAMKQMKFQGNVAGAWLAIDTDVSGAISLREIDSESNDLLIEFKRWADEEFGGIRTAFKVLDKDRSNELTLQEFSSAVRSYGFNGKEVLLFRCLDVNSQGKLQLHEVSFLDDWELENPADELENAGESGGIDLGDCSNPTQSGKLDSGTTFKERNSIEDSMFDYQTAAPGPGAYELLSGFGAMDRMPSARHGGAWSFSKRPEPTWLGELKSVGPEGSVADTSILKRRKPAWAFSRETTKSRLERPTDSPGPGSYELMSASTRSPKFTFGTRRGVVLHPLQKADGLKTRHSVRGADCRSKAYFC